MFPPSLSDITLIQWIAYTNKLRPLDEEFTTLQQLQTSKRKEILLTKNHVNKAFESAMHYRVSGDLFVEDVLKLYECFMQLFNEPLPEIEVPTIDKINFGQFIDAKMMIQGSISNNKSRWELMPYLLVIFNGASWIYKPEMLNEKSDQFQCVLNTPISIVFAFSAWWEQFNNSINENYPVFQDSGEEEGEHMKLYMEKWGWINFIKTIAKTKAFDIQGSNMNSIDCVRATPLDDVLVWASDEKECNVATMRDIKK